MAGSTRRSRTRNDRHAQALERPPNERAAAPLLMLIARTARHPRSQAPNAATRGRATMIHLNGERVGPPRLAAGSISTIGRSRERERRQADHRHCGVAQGFAGQSIHARSQHTKGAAMIRPPSHLDLAPQTVRVSSISSLEPRERPSSCSFCGSSRPCGSYGSWSCARTYGSSRWRSWPSRRPEKRRSRRQGPSRDTC
jgi:hypothetical protein